MSINNDFKLSNDYDHVLKLPTTIEEVNNLIEVSSAKIEFAKNSVSVVEKKETKKKDIKSSKTIEEKDREKLDEKFSNKKKDTLN